MVDKPQGPLSLGFNAEQIANIFNRPFGAVLRHFQILSSEDFERVGTSQIEATASRGDFRPHVLLEGMVVAPPSPEFSYRVRSVCGAQTSLEIEAETGALTDLSFDV